MIGRPLRPGQLIPRQLFLGGLRDTLALLAAESRPGQGSSPLRMAPQGVRVPGRMRENALRLLEHGRISRERAAAYLVCRWSTYKPSSRSSA